MQGSITINTRTIYSEFTLARFSFEDGEIKMFVADRHSNDVVRLILTEKEICQITKELNKVIESLPEGKVTS